MSRNFQGLPHRDKHDVTYQYAMILGDFQSGRLPAETSDPNTPAGDPLYCSAAACAGWCPHTGGGRYSVITYSVEGQATPVSDEKNAHCDPPSPLEPL